MSNLKLDGADLTSGEIAQIKADLGISTVTDASLASSAATAANVSSAVTQMTATQASPIILTNKFRGLILPQYEGAKGTGFAGAGAAVDGGGAATNVLKMANFKFNARHIGAKVSYGGWDGTYTITAVTPEGWGVLDAVARHSWPAYWMGGHDDTAVLQACIDEAATMHISHHEIFGEVFGGSGGRRPTGGVVQLDPIYTFCVDNSAASFAGGKLSALALKPGVHLYGAGGSEHDSRIQALPTLRGAILGTASSADNTPFSSIAHTTIMGDQDLCTYQTHGLKLTFPGAGSIPDLYLRILGVLATGSMGIGAEFGGVGELDIERFGVRKAKQWGAYFKNQNDWKMRGGMFENTGWAGLCIEGGGPANAIGWKAFYCGIEGQSDSAKCAGLALLGSDQMHGCGTLVGEVQETRGASVYTQVGCTDLRVNCFDAFSQKLNGGVCDFGSDDVTGVGVINADPAQPMLKARPAKRASIVIEGPNARNNDLDCKVFPTVNYWVPANDTDKKSAIYIDGYTLGAGGPQANTGKVKVLQDTLDPGGATRTGHRHNAGSGYPKVAGGGATNGKNTGLSVDGVPLT